jgi:hypothetical protein
MRSVLAVVMFLLVAFLPFHALSTTLDEFMSPDQLAREFGLPGASSADFHVTSLPTDQVPLTPAQVQERYGVDVFAEFPVVIVINTAAEGKTAQHLTVYSRGQLVGDFLTSTGRDQYETPPAGVPYFSSTPSGWYSPVWFDRDHYSRVWEARMEFSIFFNAGIAIHATTPDHYDELGHKASGGCVRLTRENAETVWNFAYNQPKVMVPVFLQNGELLTTPKGQVLRQLASGVLILVISLND